MNATRSKTKLIRKIRRESESVQPGTIFHNYRKVGYGDGVFYGILEVVSNGLLCA